MRAVLAVAGLQAHGDDTAGMLADVLETARAGSDLTPMAWQVLGLGCQRARALPALD
jgi:hypothetical protein